MAFVPIALMVASAAMSAYGSIQQGKVASANATSQANAEKFNAAIEDQNRSQAGAMASSRELQVRQRAQQQMGEQRAALSEGGQAGTPGADLIQRQSALNGEMDALNTRYAGVLQSRNAGIAESQDMYQSQVSMVNASQARQAGNWGAATSLIGGASSIYGYQNNTRIPRYGGSGYG